MNDNKKSVTALAEDKITEICRASKEKNPVAIASEIMKCEEIRLHGPEHHYLIAASLLTAYCNALKIEMGEELEKVRVRASKIPPATCATYGVCGGAPAAGCFLSTILKTNYLSREEWMLTNQIASGCQREIAKYSGPRCCKRNTYISLLAATEYLNERLKAGMDLPREIECIYSNLNETCLKEDCGFYKKVRQTGE